MGNPSTLRKTTLQDKIDNYTLLIHQAEKLYKDGKMTEALNKHVQEAAKYLKDDGFVSRFIKENAQNEFYYFQGRCIVTEIMAYFGNVKETRELLRDGNDLFTQLESDIQQLEQLPKEKDNTLNYQIVREKIRLCLDYAHYWFYWDNRYETAKEWINICIFLLHKISDEHSEAPKVPCYCTLAQAYFYQGRVHTRLHDYAEAEKCFAKSLEYYHHRSSHIINKNCTEDEKKRELKFVRYKTGIVLALGLARVNYTTGRLRVALNNNILLAKILWVDTEDDFNSSYLSIMEGAIRRGLDGEEGRAQALKILSSAHHKLQELEKKKLPLINLRYKARAAYEMALTYLDMKQFDEAEKNLKQVEDYAKANNDQRWNCKAFVVRSRINIGKAKIEESLTPDYLNEAVRLAKSAADLAKIHQQTPSQIHALIVGSTAKIDLNHYGEARKDLEKALELEKAHSKKVMNANPTIKAICNLFIALSYALEHEKSKAEVYFESAGNIIQNVEHAIVHNLFSEVKEKINALDDDFLIPANTEDFDYLAHVEKLQRFLVNRARISGKNQKTNEEVAHDLKVSRQTIFGWYKKWENPKPKKK